MKPSFKSLLPVALLVSSAAHATFTPNDSINADGWIQIRESTGSSNEWRIFYSSGTILSFRSEASNEANLALHIDNASFTGAVGRLVAYRHPDDSYTYIGLKNEEDKWVFRSLTNITSSPNVYRTEFFSNGAVIAGFYDTSLGLGTSSPTAKLHVVGDAIFANSSTTPGYTEAMDQVYISNRASSGDMRGLYVRSEYRGTTSASSSIIGVLGSAVTDVATTANLTSTADGGSLKNRFSIRHEGAGAISQVSSVTGYVDVDAGSIIDSAAFHAEPADIVSGTSITNHHGVWVRGTPTAGLITTNYGVRVDSLQAGTNRFGLYVASDPTYLGGQLTVAGAVNAQQGLRTAPKGNLSMGSFTAGTNPAP